MNWIGFIGGSTIGAIAGFILGVITCYEFANAIGAYYKEGKMRKVTLKEFDEFKLTLYRQLRDLNELIYKLTQKLREIEEGRTPLDKFYRAFILPEIKTLHQRIDKLTKPTNPDDEWEDVSGRIYFKGGHGYFGIDLKLYKIENGKIWRKKE